MADARWSPDDLPWDRLDPGAVDPDVLALAKTAALIEANGSDYGAYLCNIFHGDPDFQAAARDWALEEEQHGRALGRWAAAVDPTFDFEAAVRRFRAAYRVPIEVDRSVRGSRSGELVARCLVETGTSSYYSAIGERTAEPVLKELCRHIAADELRHYKLFLTHLRRYAEQEGAGRLVRIRIALGRLREAEDDELATAWWAANAPGEPYDRRAASRAYLTRAARQYRPWHMERAVAMIFKAAGLSSRSVLCRATAKGAGWFVGRRYGGQEPGRP